MTPTTVLMAQIIGPILAISAIGVLLNLKKLPKMIDDMGKNIAFLYVTGMFTLILGVIAVTVHSQWDNLVAIIVSVLCWMALIKGAVFMVAPDHLMKLGKKMVKNQMLYLISAVVMAILGLYLVCQGYFG